MLRDRRRLIGIVLWAVPFAWTALMASLHWASLERYADNSVWWGRIGPCIGVSDHPQAGYVLVSYQQETVSCAEVTRRYPDVVKRLSSFRAFDEIDDTVYWIIGPLLVYGAVVWLVRRGLSLRRA